MASLTAAVARLQGRTGKAHSPPSAAVPAACRPLLRPWKPSRRSKGRVDSSTGSSAGGGGGGGGDTALPPDSAGVLGWAAASFREAANTNLTKACLLLALEEEAAAQAITAYADAEGWGPDTARLGWVGGQGVVGRCGCHADAPAMTGSACAGHGRVMPPLLWAAARSHNSPVSARIARLALRKSEGQPGGPWSLGALQPAAHASDHLPACPPLPWRLQERGQRRHVVVGTH